MLPGNVRWAKVSMSDIHEQVDAFLLSLPLGTSAEDAAIEKKVAQRLIELMRELAALQQNLDEWATTASDMRALTENQKEEIELLKEAVAPASTLRFSPTRAKCLDFEWGYATQQHEIAELKSMISALRDDLRGNSLAPDDLPAYDALLERLGEAQQQLGELHAAHDLALENQANLSRKELEAVVLDVRKLESLAEEREDAIQEAYEEQERLRRVHIASEVELEHSTRAKIAVQLEVQELKSALAACQGELEAVRDRAATSSKGVAGVTLPGADDSLQQRVAHKHLAGHADVSGQAAEVCGCASAPEEKRARGSQSGQTELGAESGAAARSAGIEDSCPTDEREAEAALRVSAAAWHGALASEVDRLQQELKSAQDATEGQELLLGSRLAEAHQTFDAKLGAAQQKHGEETGRLKALLAAAAKEATAAREEAAQHIAASTTQIAVLEEQLELSRELEAAIAEDLSAASTKLEQEHQELQGAEAALVEASHVLREAQAELRMTRKAAAEHNTAAERETGALAAEVRRLRGAADAENARLRLTLREAETRADKLAASLDEAREFAARIEQKITGKKDSALGDTQLSALRISIQPPEASVLRQGDCQEPASGTTTPYGSRTPHRDSASACMGLGEVSATDPANPEEPAERAAESRAWFSEHEGELSIVLAERMQGMKRTLAKEWEARAEEQEERHEAEIASMSAAFDARADAMHRDLEVKLSVIEELEPAWQTAEGRLAETVEELEKTQNSLADCQEMLEELQAFSETQEMEIAELRGAVGDREAAEEEAISDLAAQSSRSQQHISKLNEQIAELRQQAEAQQARAAGLEAERDRVRLELAEAVGRLSLLEQLRRGGQTGPSGDEAEGSTQLAVLTEALEQNREEYSKRLDLLAGQIAEEARRRAEAEAQALAYYRAHTQTQAKSQEQNESLLRKIFEQEQAIKRLLSRHPDFTPNSRASMLNALSDTSLNKTTAHPGSPQPRALDFGQENVPAATSIASTSPKPPCSAKKVLSPARGAFQHLHFNPVFKDSSSQRHLEAERAKPSPKKAVEATQSSGAAGENTLSPLPRGGSKTRATSPNRWVKVGETHGSSQWRKDSEAES